MSRITSVATANDRKWSFGKNSVSGARVRSRGAGFALWIAYAAYGRCQARDALRRVSRAAPGVEVCPGALAQ